MEIRARFIPTDTFPGSGKPKAAAHVENDNDAGCYCFPTIDNLLSKEATSVFSSAKSFARPSPYEIKDNQYLFELPGLTSKKGRLPSQKSARTSKSPPPRHMNQLLPQSSAQSSKISIDNFNPEVFVSFNDQNTLDAIESLGITLGDLFYPPQATQQMRDVVDLKVLSVRREKERLSSRNCGIGARSLTTSYRALSPPHRKIGDSIPETFKDNQNIHAGFVVGSHKRSASLVNEPSFVRIKTSDGRRMKVVHPNHPKKPN